MADTKIKYNDSNDSLWCVYCKCRIHLGEKFAVVTEEYFDEKIKKTYHAECIPETPDEDENEIIEPVE